MILQINKRVINPVYFSLFSLIDKRYVVLYGGSGSGKSFAITQFLLIKALAEKRKILACRKIGRTVKNSVFQLFVDTLVDWHIIDKCKINRSDFTIDLPNGSQILCAGVDNPEKLKSIVGLTDAWLEEASEFTFEDFSQIDLRIRHPLAENQCIYLTFNPVSKANWVYKKFFAEDVSKDFLNNTYILKTTYRDNPHLPQTYIDSLLLLKQTNPLFYQIYAEGEFGSLSRLVFNNWQIQDFDFQQIHGELLCGLDFGFCTDPTVLTAAILTEQNELYVFYAHFAKGLTNDKIADLIQSAGFAKSVIIADSAEMKSIEEIRRLGIRRIKPAEKGAGSVNQGIQKLQQLRIFIHPSLVELKEEFENYSYKKDKASGEYINTPEDCYNHGIDALRYSLQAASRHIKTFDKSLLGL